MSTDERNSEAMQNITSSDWLSDNFGVRFRYNALGDINANIIVPADQAFGITEGVSAVAMHAGSTLAITDPEKAKGIVYLPKPMPNGITPLTKVYITVAGSKKVHMWLYPNWAQAKRPSSVTLPRWKMPPEIFTRRNRRTQNNI